MPDKNFPKSHGRNRTEEEIGMEFSPNQEESKKNSRGRKNNLGSIFKKMREKANEIARQNLE